MELPHNNPLISHHYYRDMDRCLVVPWAGRRVLLCARCTGCILGMGVGVALAAENVTLLSPWLCLLALPDWLLAATGIWRGTNAVRVLSGMLIGVLYVLNVVALLFLRLPLDLWLTNILMVGVLWIRLADRLSPK